MCKSVKKNKAISRYMEALALHNGSPTVHWEEKTVFISVVEAKIVTPRVKHIDITVWFLQEILYNVLFFPKYLKSSVFLADIFIKLCSVTIISRSNNWMTGFNLYPTIDTEHFQLVRWHKCVVNFKTKSSYEWEHVMRSDVNLNKFNSRALCEIIFACVLKMS